MKTQLFRQPTICGPLKSGLFINTSVVTAFPRKGICYSSYHCYQKDHRQLAITVLLRLVRLATSLKSQQPPMQVFAGRLSEIAAFFHSFAVIRKRWKVFRHSNQANGWPETAETF